MERGWWGRKEEGNPFWEISREKEEEGPGPACVQLWRCQGPGKQLSRKRQQVEGFDFHCLREVWERKIETQRGLERGREMGNSQTKREKEQREGEMEEGRMRISKTFRTENNQDRDRHRDTERVRSCYCSAERSEWRNQEVQHVIKHPSKEWGPCKMWLPSGERALVLQLPVGLRSLHTVVTLPFSSWLAAYPSG